MRIAVAGSSGLIGTALVDHLRDREHDVIRLVRHSDPAADERAWDPARSQAPDLSDVDAVVNLAGAAVADKRWSEQRKQQLRDSRIDSTTTLVCAATTAGVSTLINASAVGFYGDTGSQVVDESSPSGSDFLAELCVDWEKATEPAHEAGMRVARVRTGLVLSAQGGLLAQLKPIVSLFLGGRLGSGTHYMPWVSLTDEIAAITFALENDQVSGPLNLTGPHPVTNAEFTRTLGRLMGRPTPWIVPGFVLRAALGEAADVAILSGQRAVPTALREAGFEFAHPTLTEALVAALSS